MRSRSSSAFRAAAAARGPPRYTRRAARAHERRVRQPTLDSVDTDKQKSKQKSKRRVRPKE